MTQEYEEQEKLEIGEKTEDLHIYNYERLIKTFGQFEFLYTVEWEYKDVRC